MTDIDGSFASCRLGIMRTCVSPLKLTCFTPVALFTVRFIADPMLCKVLRPRCRILVLVVILLILPSICAVLINLYCALPVSSFSNSCLAVFCTSDALVEE